MAGSADYRTYYDDFYTRGDFDHYPSSVNRAMIGLLVRRYFSGAAHLADFGCGTGVHLRCFEEAGKSVTGIDISGVALRAALAKGGTSRLVHGDAARSPFMDAAFDGAVSFGCSLLNGLDMQVFTAFAAEALRVVRPGGWSLLCTRSDFSGSAQSGWRQIPLPEFEALARSLARQHEILTGYPRLFAHVGASALSPLSTRLIRALRPGRNAMVVLALRRDPA